MGITVGMKGEVSSLVEREDTALEVGSGSLLVYATPCMAAMMEGAACAAIEEAQRWTEKSLLSPSKHTTKKVRSAARSTPALW